MNAASVRTRRIAYHPFFATRAEKGYTFRMREALGAFGDVVAFDGIVATWRRHGSRHDLLVLNWTDNDLVDRRTHAIALRKVAKLFMRTIVLRLAARRLVFVRHNVHPHAIAPGGAATARRWIDRYERLFDVVLTHSGDESQRPRAYCPHPLYRVGPIAAESAWSRSLPTRFFVAFGRIVRYKRLERLIAAFPEDETLLVIGAVGDRRYVDELAASLRPNVVFRPGFIDEAEAQAIVARSAALLIAHADADVVVSASFFFAMSLHVPVIAVATPYLRWIAPRVGPRLLRVADDMEALCAMTRDRTVDGAVAPQDIDATEREFGDRAVQDALSRALRITVQRLAR